MSENKCCGNCKHFKDEDANGFGLCSKDGVITRFSTSCSDYSQKFNGWTEITPENVALVDCIPNDKVVIGWICNDEFRSCSLSCFWFTLNHIAHHGGFYYLVLPELKIE